MSTPDPGHPGRPDPPAPADPADPAGDVAVDVAVDVGQSGLRLRLVGPASGSTEVRTTGASHHDGDLTDVLTASIAAAWARARAQARAGGSGPGPAASRIRRLVAGCTALPTGARREALAARLAAATGAEQVWLCEDIVTAHRGALPGGTGVVLSVGTGVACLAAGPAGLHRVDGAGYLLGDDGGGHWIGARGLAAVLRAHDGRGPATALTAAATAEFGPPGELAIAVHERPRPVAAVAAFAPHVLAAAAAGDAVARAVLAAAVAELAGTARAAVAWVTGGREAAPAAKVPLALSGGLLHDPAFAAALTAAIERQVPAASLRPPEGGALDGAAALAAGGDPGALAPLLLSWPPPTDLRPQPDGG